MTGKEKNHEDHRQRPKRETTKVCLFLPEHLSACRQTFVGKFTKKAILNHHTVALRRENRPTVREKAGRWSRKAGGRYSQCSFCMKLSVHEKAAVGTRWTSLFAVVAEARYYCTVYNQHTCRTCLWFSSTAISRGSNLLFFFTSRGHSRALAIALSKVRCKLL